MMDLLDTAWLASFDHAQRFVNFSSESCQRLQAAAAMFFVAFSHPKLNQTTAGFASSLWA
jgi:phospholipase/lecithinase/hemolysin